MASFVPAWFDSSSFMPHGTCFLWSPALLAQFTTSDTLIGISYCSIPIALVYFARHRPDMGFGWILALFSAFILACGATHFLAVWTIWHATYWLDAMVKNLTALVSAVTAITLWLLMPRAVKLPSVAQVRHVVDQLEQQVVMRNAAQVELAKLNASLEARVTERTAALTAINTQLQAEINLNKRTSEALQQSEARFRALIASTSETTWRADLQGNIIERTLTRLDPPTDYSFPESRPLWAHPVHPDDQAVNRDFWKQGLSGRIPFGHEYRLQSDSGEWRFMEYQAIPILDQHGAIGEWIGMTRDISSRYVAQEKVRVLNGHIRELVTIVQQLASTRDLQSILDAVKTSARRLVGADAAAIIFCSGAEVQYIDEEALGPQWKGRVFPLAACVSGAAIVNRSPVVIDDIDLDRRTDLEAYRSTFVKSLAMVPMQSVEPIGAIGVYWAQSRKLGADDLQLLTMLADAAAIAIENTRQYAMLETRVAERTAQFKSANEELETFTYSVSHDLKAPLRGIDGYSRILLEDYAEVLGEQPRRFLHNIRTGAQQMGELIEDLLNYSRLERREQRVGLLDVQQLIGSIQALYAGEIERAGIRLQIKVPAGEILADREGLEIALRNLLDNAIKFSRKAGDGPTIEIGGKLEQNTYQLWIRDNGIGFDMQFSQRVFEIFQRLNRIEDYPGTGIGLAIVRKAIQRMNGKVWAQSKVGEGSTFFLELPQ